MPRKKKSGSWGDGSDKFSASPSGPGYNSYGISSSSESSKSPMDQVAWSGSAKNSSGMQISDPDIAIRQVQEMFNNQVDRHIIHMQLIESQWNVEEAVEKLRMMASNYDQEQYPVSQQSHAFSRPENIPGANQSRLPARRSRTSESGSSLTMLSPKTPSQIGMNYPDMFGAINTQHANMQSAAGMGAFDSYGMEYSGGYRDAPHMPFDSNMRRIAQGYSAHNYGTSIIAHDNYTSSMDSFHATTSNEVDTSNVENPLQSVSSADQYKDGSLNGGKSSDSSTKNKMASTHQEQKSRALKRGRKTTMSLNPEEREALENLIEDVIVGIGEGVIDSEESTSTDNESEEEVHTPTETVSKEERLKSPTTGSDDNSEQKNKSEKSVSRDNRLKSIPKDVKKEGKNEHGQKVYPPQLKVAVKHMKNLPPRFLRKIQTNKDDDIMKLSEKPQRIQELPEPPEPSKPVEILTKPKIEQTPLIQRERDFRNAKSKEEQKLEKKKKVRGMLDTLDIYFEQSVSNDDKKGADKEPKYESGEVAIIAPVNENPYQGDKLTHSAPASTQVSPNTQPNTSKELDIGHLDPAIKAQGPPLLSLNKIMNQAPPPLSSGVGQNVHRTQKGLVPDSPGMNCEELEREMFQLSAADHTQDTSHVQNVPYNAMSQAAPSVNLDGLSSGVILQDHISSSSQTQFTHSPPSIPQSTIQQPRFTQHALLQQNALNQSHVDTSHQAMTSPKINQFGQYVQMNQPVRMPFGAHLHHQHKSQFSVDAPEFVPRTFTPIATGQAFSSHGSTYNIPTSNQPIYVANLKSQAMPVVPSSQQIMVPGLVSSMNSQLGGIPTPQAMQAPPPTSVQIPEGFTAPPPPLPPQPLGIGRASPQVNATSVAGLAQPTPEQLASVAMGRSSPVPGTQVPPAFMIPKVPPQNVAAHPSLAQAPPGGMGMVYAPVYQPYPPGVHPTAQYPIHAAGHFLVPAWSGGKKDKFNHTLPLHHCLPATQKLSGIPTKARNAGLHSKGAAMSPKIPHRGQNEMSPQQAKEKVMTLMNQGKKVMLILRGLPGSGKSTLAKEAKFNGVVLSTDDFFVKDGKYEYDFSRLSEAHEWNRLKANEAVEKNTSPIIIDNTHTQAWEMRPYVSLALKHDYHIEIVEPNTTWKFKVKELAQRNSHSVSAEKIQQMADRYENHVTIDRVMGVSERKKTDDALATQDGETGGEEKKPKRRRRRRRRRKKKPVEENPSDSEKEEQSSDDEIPIKPEKVIQRLVSTDTTENEMEKPPCKTAVVKEAKLAKLSSSSIDSEEPHTVHEVRTTVDVRKPSENNSTVSESKIVQSIDCAKLQENVSKKEDFALNNETGDVNIGEKTKVEAGNSTDVADKNSGDFDEGFQEILVKDGSLDDGEAREYDEISHPRVLDELKMQKEESVDQDLELDCLAVSGNDSENSSPSKEEEGMQQGLVVISQNFVNELESGGRIADKVKTAIRVEIENFVKEQIVDSLLNDELPKYTDSVCRENAVTSFSTEISHADKEQFSDNEWEEPNNPLVLEKTNELPLTKDTIEDKDSDLDICDKTVASDANCESLKDKVAVSERETAYWSSTNVVDCESYVVCDEKTKNVATKEQSTSSKGELSSGDALLIQQPKQQRERREKREKENDDTIEKSSSDVVDSSNVDKDSHKEKGGGDQFVEKQSSSNVPNRKKMLKTGVLDEHTPGTIACVDGVEKSKSWKASLPQFTSEISALQSLNLQDSCKDKCLTDAQTFTSSADLTAVEKLLHGLQDPNFVVDFQILNATAREINQGCLKNDSPSPSSLSPSRTHPTRNESTMTDIEDTSKAKESLAFLKRHFPEADDDYISHILAQCEGNTDAAVNDLLDAGYEMKFEDSKLSDASDTIDTKTPGHVGEERKGAGVENVSCESIVSFQASNPQDVRPKEISSIELPLKQKQEIESKCPPSLFTLCHAYLSREDDMIPGEICEGIASAGIKRLCSIDEFKRRSISEETPSHLDMSNRSRYSDSFSEVFTNMGLTMPPEADLESILSLPDPSTLFRDGSPDLYRTKDGVSAKDSVIVKEDAEAGIANVSAGSDEIEGEETELTLTVQLAEQLIHLFGPIGFPISPESMSEDDLRVRLSRKVAKQIHHRWSLTLKKKFAFEEAAIDKMIREESDEALARRLQEEEDGHNFSTVPDQQLSKNGALHESTRDRLGKNEPESFFNIMNEQYEEQAIQESRRDYESRSASSPERHMATRLKKQQLYEDYPLIDQPVIDDIFEAAGFSIDKTKAKLEEMFGKKEPVKNVMTEEAKYRMEQELIKRTIRESMQEEWLGEDVYDVGGYEQLHGNEYDMLREETSMYYKLRHEAFEKAQDAYRRGMKPLASWYSQVGHLYSKKLKDSNKRAAELMVQERSSVLGSNTIDLHGVHLEEALAILKREMERREKDRREKPELRKSLRVLSVVTGWGKHSQGQAKLRPNIITWLNQHEYTFSEPTIGKLDIVLK